MFTKPAGVFVQFIGLLLSIVAASITASAVFGPSPSLLIMAILLWAVVYGLLRIGRNVNGRYS